MLNNLALKEDALVNIQNIFVMYAISVELPVSKNIFGILLCPCVVCVSQSTKQ